MTESIKQLIEALRAELQEYGGMLALLDRQQQLVVERMAGEVYQTVSLIQTQGLAVQEARANREKFRQALARELGLPDETTFADLIPAMPADYRPLLKALVEENNELLVRVQHRARQNHLLLRRSVELMQGLLNSFLPAREMKVYNDRGNMDTRAAPARRLYDAKG
jgi:flagellar biosynthesis/type III secretory pathway chaperone